MANPETRKLRVRFFGRIRKRICDPRSYGFFDTKETQNPKKDYFVMTRQAGRHAIYMSERYFSRTALEFNYNGIQIIYKQEQYLQ